MAKKNEERMRDLAIITSIGKMMGYTRLSEQVKSGLITEDESTKIIAALDVVDETMTVEEADEIARRMVREAVDRLLADETGATS
jgi:hypothetical protein